MFARRTKIGIQPMSKTNVGANLVLARRTKTDIKPMFENELETFATNIGLIAVFVRGEHKVRRSTQKFMTAYLCLYERKMR